jgi:enoyl-CoA hydratase/carnithine racemase
VSTFHLNGRGSPAWAGSWTHLRVDRRSPGDCRVTFDHPPVNAVTAVTVAELTEVVELIESDDDLRVVVFDSANRDVYLGDCDPAVMPAWRDLLERLSRTPAVRIASIRGRSGDAGSEFALACDLRLPYPEA